MNQYQTYYQECSAPSSSSTRTEIGDQAVWTLSSSKPGNGIEQLRDDNNNTFWQSDGSQPHTITIQFMKKVKLMEVGIYLDFKCDESYTPNKISFRIGGNISDLREYVCLDLKEPVGWFIVPFKTIQSNGVEKEFISTMNI
jgi:anaphase-promoting complex subunit 10